MSLLPPLVPLLPRERRFGDRVVEPELPLLVPDPVVPVEPVESGDVESDPVPLVPEPLVPLPDPVVPVPEPLVPVPEPVVSLPARPLSAPAGAPEACAFATAGAARKPDRVSANSIFRMTVSFRDVSSLYDSSSRGYGHAAHREQPDAS